MLQNLALSIGDNEEAVYCLAAWQSLPRSVTTGQYPSKEDALKVRSAVAYSVHIPPVCSFCRPCVLCSILSSNGLVRVQKV